MNKPPLGTGQRFHALQTMLSHRPGVMDPAALAASIGRKKYGNKRYTQLAVAGKKKQTSKRYA